MTKHLAQIDNNNVIINVIVVDESMTAIQAGVTFGGTYVDIGPTGIGYQYDPIGKKAIYIPPNIPVIQAKSAEQTKSDLLNEALSKLKSALGE